MQPYDKETIFALSTAPGRAGVAVMRISGPNAFQACEQLAGDIPPPRRASLRMLVIPGTKQSIDRALTLTFQAPHSFTGEDVVEFHLHGSPAVIRAVTQCLSQIPGLRPAEPGEFSRRAFDNDRMDLTQAEGLSDLISADTEAQRKQALAQMEGVLEKLYTAWRQEIIAALAEIEAYIDFPDENLPQTLTRHLTQRVTQLQHAIAAHSHDRRGELLREGISAVILGAPNVGKSSLMNMLAKRDVAIVSHIAGTTRDVIEVQLDIAGFKVTLYDTAGLRESADSIELEGITRARARAEKADIALLLFDGEQWPAHDAATLQLAEEYAAEKCLFFISRSDLCNTPPENPTIQHQPVIAFSTKTGQGVDTVLDALENWLQQHAAPGEHPVFTRERHRIALDDCHQALQRFLDGEAHQKAIELRAEDLRIAATALAKITGRIDVEDILDTLFRQFCIGK